MDPREPGIADAGGAAREAAGSRRRRSPRAGVRALRSLAPWSWARPVRCRSPDPVARAPAAARRSAARAPSMAPARAEAAAGRVSAGAGAGGGGDADPVSIILGGDGALGGRGTSDAALAAGAGGDCDDAAAEARRTADAAAAAYPPARIAEPPTRTAAASARGLSSRRRAADRPEPVRRLSHSSARRGSVRALGSLAGRHDRVDQIHVERSRRRDRRRSRSATQRRRRRSWRRRSCGPGPRESAAPPSPRLTRALPGSPAASFRGARPPPG